MWLAPCYASGMSLSDCPECWETPCVCGEGYRGYSLDRAAQLCAAVMRAQPDQEAVYLLAVRLNRCAGPLKPEKPRPLLVEVIDYAATCTITEAEMQDKHYTATVAHLTQQVALRKK